MAEAVAASLDLAINKALDQKMSATVDDTKQCAISLGLQVQSVVAREFFPQG
jgi:hypothetical protein